MKRWERWFAAMALVLAVAVPAGGGEETKPAAPPAVKAKACVIDLDGTIADETARRAEAEAKCPREKDKSGYYEIYFSPTLIAKDKPIEKSREVLKWVGGRGVEIYYVSSRGKGCTNASVTWIRDNGFPAGKRVYHQESPEQSVPYKTRTIKKIQEDADVLFGVGDSDTDIEAYGNCGIKAIKVEVNSDKDWERVKTEIEKILAEKK